jgi:hypothetical protein
MPLENSEVGMILLFMRGYGDRLEAKKFQDRVRRHRDACKRAKRIHAANTAPYGYYNDFRVDAATGKKIFTGTRAVDAEAAEVLLKMARWIVLEGMTATQVTKRLNQERVPCPAARRGYRYRRGSAASCLWNSGKVCRLMRDPTYLGRTYVSQYRFTGTKTKTGKRLNEKLPVSEWELLTDDKAVTPQIIPDELFDAVQRRLDANREGEHTTRNTRKPVLLRGLVFCAECGNKMYAAAAHSTHKPSYRCSSYGLKDGFRCPGTTVGRAELEEKVWRRVAEIYRSPEVAKREIAAALEASGINQLEGDLRIAEDEIARRRAYLDDVVSRMLQASRAGRTIVANALDAESESVEDEIGRLERMAAQLRAGLAAKGRAGALARRLSELHEAYRAGFEREMPFERRRDALAALGVTVYASSKRKPLLRANLGAVLRPATAGRASRPRP